MKRKKWPFSKAFGDDPKREWIYQLEDKLVTYAGGFKCISRSDFIKVVEDFNKCTGHKP